ncbi:MAG: DUF3160 domain-containing protein [Akkermansiaceae bacterium]
MSALSAQELRINSQGNQILLSWERAFPEPTGVPSELRTRVLSSTDLINWAEETMLTAEEVMGDGISDHLVTPREGAHFFQIEQSTHFKHRVSSSDQPASYDLQLKNLEAKQPPLSITQFIAAANDPGCVDQLDWDPRTAAFWTEYNMTPDEHNADLPPDDPERRLSDFTLNEEELALFLKNGFVISDRVARTYEGFDTAEVPLNNPVDYYHSIWTDDLPVYVTADSVLDAWHKTFLAMLEEVEELHLYPTLRRLLSPGGISDLSELYAEWENAEAEGADKVRQAVRDLDLYLGVASQLNNGGIASSKLLDPMLVDSWYQAVITATDPERLGLYGDEERIENMTLFKVRGHYVNSHALGAYFQSLLWLSRMQFHIASPHDRPQEMRELRGAVLLTLQINDPFVLELWDELENTMQLLVGQSDAMTIREMKALLQVEGISSVSDIASDTKMGALREAILSTTYGIQEINGGQHEAVLGQDGCDELSAPLPRALSLFGQRWTPDAWAFNQLVVPNIRDDQDKTLHRRKPSGVDAMYAVLGNDAAAPILGNRMLDQDGIWLRDGIPFQDELQAVREVMDGQAPEFWTEHIYGSWLYSLRALSPTVANGPDTFRTPAWKQRMMNTQLASWTHLRHDTLLYAEQSFTPPILCDFPDGYVEPYPQFWQRLSEMALSYKAALGSLALSGGFRVEARVQPNPWEPSNFSKTNLVSHWNVSSGYQMFPVPIPGNEVNDETTISIDRGTRTAVICDHLEHFSSRCLQLKGMAEAQLSGTPYDEAQKELVATLVEDVREVGYVGKRLYSGWFPNLYLASLFSINADEHPSAVWSPVVVDVHTDSLDTICTGDPGGVLHQGVGRTQFMLIAVKHSDGTACTYGGPVFNHYEFWTADSRTRWNNEQWESALVTGNEPAQADWKKSFRVGLPETE